MGTRPLLTEQRQTDPRQTGWAVLNGQRHYVPGKAVRRKEERGTF